MFNHNKQKGKIQRKQHRTIAKKTGKQKQNNVMGKNNFYIIIAGATGTGKTEISYSVANHIKKILEKDVEIINGDMGQLYEPLTIGTAKPEITNETKISHHLFSIIKTPTNYSTKEYREKVKEEINKIWERNNVPIIVGGSGFYIKSLFFTTDKKQEITANKPTNNTNKNLNKKQLWELLNEIDKKRASEINQNDKYRIERALEIWMQTGEKPSNFEEKPNPIYNNCYFYYIERTKENLIKRIEERIDLMLKKDWIEETEKLDIPWKNFIKKKKFIGYPEIINFIEAENSRMPITTNKELNRLKEKINTKTIQYVKKQKTFFKQLIEKLKLHSNNNIDKIIFKEIKKIIIEEQDSHERIAIEITNGIN